MPSSSNSLTHERALGVYSYQVRAATTGTTSGDTIRCRISALQKAPMWGWPFRLRICIIGLLVAGLGVSSVLIWRGKRHGLAKATGNLPSLRESR